MDEVIFLSFVTASISGRFLIRSDLPTLEGVRLDRDRENRRVNFSQFFRGKTHSAHSAIICTLISRSSLKNVILPYRSYIEEKTTVFRNIHGSSVMILLDIGIRAQGSTRRPAPPARSCSLTS